MLARGSLLDPSLPMTFVGSAGLSQIETAIEKGEDHTGERYVLVQPCFRHFDIERVHHSPVHLSLFEMGGAFSFGEALREKALKEIWAFLINDLGLCKEQIWVTYFTGGNLEEHQFAADEAIHKTWRDIGVSPEHIVGVGIDRGFWKQGGGLSGKERFRKCGPTTEIFVDRGEQYRCSENCQPGCQCERFIEISNVLFIHSQIDQQTGTLKPLVTPFTESVIGVERVTMAARNEASVFEANVPLTALIEIIRKSHENREISQHTAETSERIIADHIKSLVFLVADGAPPPGKGGQKRIVRGLIRGILTHQKILGIGQSQFIENLLDTVLNLYQNRYPELRDGRATLLEYMEIEKRRFQKTLSRGYKFLDRMMSAQRNLSGAQAVELVKLYGLPLPLLQWKLAQRGVNFDADEYHKAYMQWKKREII